MSAAQFEAEQQTECANFRKNDLSFHACQLLSKNANPTGKAMYLVCVTTIDPDKRQEWQSSRNSSYDDPDEEDPEVEYEEDTKLKFFDYQAALRADIMNDTLEVKSLSKSLSIRIQQTAQRVWLEQDETSMAQKK